jgi:hypothetical protein
VTTGTGIVTSTATGDRDRDHDRRFAPVLASGEQPPFQF